MIREESKEPLLDYIKSIIKGCDTYQAALGAGQLDIIVNNGIVYSINVSDMFAPDDCMGINYRKKVGYEFIEDPIFNFTVYDRINFNRFDRSCPMVYFNDSFHEDDLFKLMNSLRADAGEFRFIFDLDTGGKAIITLYKGIFNLNKKDTMSISIFDTTHNIDPDKTPGTYLYVVFDVHKTSLKKSYTISFTALNLWRVAYNDHNA